MLIRITRTLAYEDAKRERKVIGQDEIAAIIEPVVILGDPGLGKSVLTQSLGERPGMKYHRAGTFVRAAKPESLIGQGERIIIDGLDEIASTALGGGVEAVLKQLSAMGNPPFILSCREADWRGAADRIKIEDDYVAAPVLLHLQPFERDDAHVFLSNEFPTIDATHVLDHLASRGLEDIYKNPLTLRLLGEVAQEAGALACLDRTLQRCPNRLTPSHAVKKEKRYRYYVSQALLQDRGQEAGAVTRIPAREIEDVIISRLRTFLMDPAGLIDGLTGPDAIPRDQHSLLTAARKVTESWARGAPKSAASFVRQALERVTLGQDEIEIRLSKKGLSAALLGSPSVGQAAAQDEKTPDSDVLVLKLPARLKRCSGEMRLVIPAGVQPDLRPRPNAALIKALCRAHTWKETLLSGPAGSIRSIAKEEGVTESYLGRLLRLAFLAPDITEAILEGSQPPDLELDRLLRVVPLAWYDQRRLFGFEPVA